MQDFNPQAFRQQFPFFAQANAPVYLDSAATSLKPQCLIDATSEFYRSAGSVHRSQYDAAQTAQYEQARELVRDLLNAESAQAVIWTSGTTQAINTVAHGLLPHLQAGDEILISQADHHAQFVTWSEIAKQAQAKLIVLPINDQWLIDEQALCDNLNERTKLVAINFVSNVTGTEQPVEKLVKLIRQKSKALICVDAAQAVAHRKIDLQQLDVDFLAFSAHKLYGPTGLGVLTGKLASLERLRPLQFGGKMVQSVQTDEIQFAPLPYRLEAGTPNIAAVIGFHAVLQWLAQYDVEQMEAHAVALAEQAKKLFQNAPLFRLFSAPQPSSVLSFVVDGVATADLATLLAEQNIAIRSGQHCAQPYLARIGERATLRLSFAPYNNQADVQAFAQALQSALELLQ